MQTHSVAGYTNSILGAQRAEGGLQQLESPSNKPPTSIRPIGWETPNMGSKLTANFLFTVKLDQNSF